jgi:acyl transferase domain-containing protein
MLIEKARAVEMTCERGAMIAVLTNSAYHRNASELIEISELAGVNFASHFVIATPHWHLGRVEVVLRRDAIVFQRLPVSFAFHSRWIGSAEASLHRILNGTEFAPARVPIMCAGATEPTYHMDGDRLWRAMRGQMQFDSAVQLLEARHPNVYLDLGPSGTLATFVRNNLGQGSASRTAAALTPFGRDRRSLQALLDTANMSA